MISSTESRAEPTRGSWCLCAAPDWLPNAESWSCRSDLQGMKKKTAAVQGMRGPCWKPPREGRLREQPWQASSVCLLPRRRQPGTCLGSAARGSSSLFSWHLQGPLAWGRKRGSNQMGLHLSAPFWMADFPFAVTPSTNSLPSKAKPL